MHAPWVEVPFGGSTFCTSVRSGEADELARLAAGEQVLEIGTARGFSAAAMVLGGAEHVTTVDPQPGDLIAVLHNEIDPTGTTDRITFITDTSQHAMPVLCAEQRQFGLVFIDGWHEAEAVRNDITFGMILLKPGGYMAIHDYAEDCCCPEVKQVVDEMGLEGQVIDTMFITQKR